MSKVPHLVVALSSHGFGHLAQVAPVLNTLRQCLPMLRLTIQTSLSQAILRKRITGDFTHIPEATDIGMIMANALEVRVKESLAAYRSWHSHWERHMAQQKALLTSLAPDLLLANIPYLPLSAAASLSLPAVALCSLHWAAILQGYCSTQPDWQALQDTLMHAYNSAAVFLRPAPSMPMPDLNNTHSIDPIAALGRNQRDQLNARLGLPTDGILILVALGGVAMPLPMEHWPVMPGIYWLVPAAWGIRRADILHQESVPDIPFTDLLRSCDVVLSKPGYGTFVEAACNGRPVLYVERNDWPEEPWLVRWLQKHDNALAVTREQLETGAILDTLHILLEQPRKPPPLPSGIEEAVSYLRPYLTV